MLFLNIIKVASDASVTCRYSICSFFLSNFKRRFFYDTKSEVKEKGGIPVCHNFLHDYEIFDYMISFIKSITLWYYLYTSSERFSKKRNRQNREKNLKPSVLKFSLRLLNWNFKWILNNKGYRKYWNEIFHW